MTIRVVQLTDIHLTATTGSELDGVDTALALESTITAISQLPKMPDVIIATGDLAEHGSKIAYARLRDLLGNWKFLCMSYLEIMTTSLICVLL